MALSRDTKYQGFDVPGAYFTVTRPLISGDKLRVSYNLQTRFGPDSEEPFADEPRSAPYDLEGTNPFEQAYEHLKTLPEFADATDC